MTLLSDFTIQRLESLYRQLRHEQQLRREAERNAAKFHAMLIAERVKHLPKRKP